jgi:hypothetical protein
MIGMMYVCWRNKSPERGNKETSFNHPVLASPRWEGRSVHFLKLSGVGRVVEGGRAEEDERAGKMDIVRHRTDIKTGTCRRACQLDTPMPYLSPCKWTL